MNVERKYGLLRAIALILKVVAWVVLVLGIIGLIVGLGATGNMDPALRPIAAAGVWALPVLAIVWFIQLYAFGSIIALLIDVEENTREMAATPPP